ncbi:hypothetical protein SK128_017685 [Halocaridina rubra]|uniref:Uncharacterized protein n=1 Tax=Halocaridina rubra TaxID=373956 RepID=A0AAN8WTK0_HALRR
MNYTYFGDRKASIAYQTQIQVPLDFERQCLCCGFALHSFKSKDEQQRMPNCHSKALPIMGHENLGEAMFYLASDIECSPGPITLKVTKSLDTMKEMDTALQDSQGALGELSDLASLLFTTITSSTFQPDISTSEVMQTVSSNTGVTVSQTPKPTYETPPAGSIASSSTTRMTHTTPGISLGPSSTGTSPYPFASVSTTSKSTIMPVTTKTTTTSITVDTSETTTVSNIPSPLPTATVPGTTIKPTTTSDLTTGKTVTTGSTTAEPTDPKKHKQNRDTQRIRYNVHMLSIKTNQSFSKERLTIPTIKRTASNDVFEYLDSTYTTAMPWKYKVFLVLNEMTEITRKITTGELYHEDALRLGHLAIELHDLVKEGTTDSNALEGVAEQDYAYILSVKSVLDATRIDIEKQIKNAKVRIFI